MLRFILGKSGSGKTAYIYDQIKRRVTDGEPDIIMLIPDQSSFETEKDFLEILGPKLSKSVSVFGFDGLCRHIFEKTANVFQNVIDDGTREVLMSVALEQLTEKLSVLKSSGGVSLADLMLGTLKECKKNGVTAQMLADAAEKTEDGSLKSKLSETALVFSTFEALVNQSYIDPLDNLARAELILLENNDLFRNTVLYVDSFSGFTSVQLRVLRILLNRCRETCVSLTLDPSAEGGDVFETTMRSLKAIKNLAKRDGIPIKTPVKLTEPKRFRGEGLSEVEAQAFRARKTPVDYAPQDVTLYAADDICNECEFIARKIKRMVIEEGFLYSDFAVICNDLKPYSGVLNAVFDKYEIPYFMDMSRDPEVMPPVRLVNSIFRLILNGFKREDALSFLKTGLTQNSLEEINAFENYIYIWNLGGTALCREFTQNPRGFSGSFTDDDRLALEKIENVRRSFVTPLLKFRDEIKDKNAAQISKLLYLLLTELNAPEALKKLCGELEESGEGALGEEQIRVWALLMNALDKTVAAVGDMPLSAKRYYELLGIQMRSIEFMQIPQTADCVNVTTAQRVRNSTQKVSFLAGCNDGVFPAVPHTSGLFSAFELKLLSLSDIKISDDFSDLAELETFMTYSCLSSASDRLFVSCPLVSLQGEQLAPSVIFTELTRIFPKISVLTSDDFDSRIDSMLAVQPAFEEYSRSLSQEGGLPGLAGYFDSDQRFAAKTAAVKRAVSREPFRIENPANAEKIFGENLTISASQIEKFSLCRFAYFCNYSLRVRERLKAEINQMEYGTLVHYALEKFFAQYSKKEYSAMTDTELSDFISKITGAYLEEYFGGAGEKTNAFLYKLEMLRRNLLLLLRHIVDELSQSDFEAADCELNIGDDIPAYTLRLPSGHKIAVCGSVDRVDLMKHDGKTFVRVVDYKTGAKEFKLSDILYGLNLQMLLYLHSIGENGAQRYGETAPAGILYMPAGVPVISADNLSEETIAKKISDNYKMNGLLLDDSRVIKGMDKTGDGVYIPVKIKDGKPYSAKSLATLEQFGKIFKKLDLTVAEMGRELYGGKIEASPVKGSHDACEYCPYGSVCSYRRSEQRKIYGVDNDEVYKQLDSETGGDENA